MNIIFVIEADARTCSLTFQRPWRPVINQSIRTPFHHFVFHALKLHPLDPGGSLKSLIDAYCFLI